MREILDTYQLACLPVQAANRANLRGPLNTRRDETTKDWGFVDKPMVQLKKGGGL